MVGKNLRIPTFLAFGEKGREGGGRLVDVKALREILSIQQKKNRIDYSMRVYEGCGDVFITNTNVSEVDNKCCQEALSIASVWLEVFSRDLNTDPTDGCFVDPHEPSIDFSLVSAQQLREVSRSSSLSNHVHDDPNFFIGGTSSSASFAK